MEMRTREGSRLLTCQTQLHSLLLCDVGVLESEEKAIKGYRAETLRAARTRRGILSLMPCQSKSGNEVLTQFSWNTVLCCNVTILFLSRGTSSMSLIIIIMEKGGVKKRSLSFLLLV
jgi:hypothetical protein